MKFRLGDEDTPWLLFLLAAAVLAMVLLSSTTHEEHPGPTARPTLKN
jgi:hypothetical protein